MISCGICFMNTTKLLIQASDMNVTGEKLLYKRFKSFFLLPYELRKTLLFYSSSRIKLGHHTFLHFWPYKHKHDLQPMSSANSRRRINDEEHHPVSCSSHTQLSCLDSSLYACICDTHFPTKTTKDRQNLEVPHDLLVFFRHSH